MKRALFIAGFAALMATPVTAEPGRLVIVGGALARDNAAVWGAFIEGLPNPQTDRIAVIAAASGEPNAAFDSVRGALAVHGVAPERVFLVKAAVVDDDATAEDESTWANGGSDPTQVALVSQAGGVWFTGGDQHRIARVLFDHQGGAGPMLTTLHRRLEQGAVIGGSSAGAAIQSEVMILRGDDLIALREDLGQPGPEAAMEDGRLILATGAGFFRHGVIDQHFDRQARLGRLARATAISAARFGFGIDENTALVVDLGAGTAGIAGPGTVTVLDDLEAAFDAAGPFQAAALRLSIAAAGDRIELATGRITPALFKTEDVMADPDLRAPGSGVQGLAAPAPRLDEILIDDLIENRDSSIERWSFDDTGRAILFAFAKTDATTAFRGRGADGRTRFTVSGVRFSVTPGSATFRPDTP